MLGTGHQAPWTYLGYKHSIWPHHSLHQTNTLSQALDMSCTSHGWLLEKNILWSKIVNIMKKECVSLDYKVLEQKLDISEYTFHRQNKTLTLDTYLQNYQVCCYSRFCDCAVCPLLVAAYFNLGNIIFMGVYYPQWNRTLDRNALIWIKWEIFSHTLSFCDNSEYWKY
jgi:hypothetical protein